MESKTVAFFNKLSFTLLIATIFGSLFFFIPYIPVTLPAAKGFLLSIGITLSFFFWLIARLGEGKFTAPRDRLIVFAAAIPVVFFLASFFSSSKYVSFFGSGFEVGTFGSMLIMFLIFFLSSLYFQTEKRLWNFFGLLLLGAFIIAIFQLLYLFVDVGSLLPGFFRGATSGNLIGSWNDFALFFGLITLLSIVTLDFLQTKGWVRVFQYFILLASIFFIIVINMPLVWLLVGLFSVIIFVYSISLQQAGVGLGGSHKKKFPFTALILILICFVFLVSNNTIGSLVSRYVNVSNSEVRLSLSATSQIALKAIKHNPFFGTGPNTFVVDWSLWKPADVAETIFWNVDFDNGFGLIPTFAATTGILGLASIALFLVILFIRGLQSFRVAVRDTLSSYFILTTLMILIYTWVAVIFYSPNIIMVMLAFASSGILIAILVYKQVVGMSEFSFLSDPRNSFFSILGIIAVMIATISTTYLYAEKFTSIIFFSKSLKVDTTSIDSLVASERMIRNAISLDGNDLYYRALSQIHIAQIGVLVSDKNISQDTLKSSIQQLVNAAQTSALEAVRQNPKQYQNHMNLGNIYAALVPLGVENSYESAVSAYIEAGKLAPQNPSIILARAQLELVKKNNAEAKKLIDQALTIKTNYAEALLLLAQIKQGEGDLPGAIKQAESAAQKSPNDPTIFFVIGSYRYNNADYKGAVDAFESAVILNPNYLNARYLLGQAYEKVGRTGDALIQYKILNKIVPENQDVIKAIESLSKGSSVPTAATETDKKPAASTTISKTKPN
jgi:tetratricopeptide (TPR) repeat protein